MNNIKAIKKGKHIEYLKFCVECGGLFVSVRSDRLACSSRCRQRLTRKKKTFKPFLVLSKEITPEELKRFGFTTKNTTTIQ
ncbi:MAG: hypothetical protein JXR68_14225 [Bacteroidales bacterium]|nr:hypothetical protein [Bacteroidales bacterium]